MIDSSPSLTVLGSGSTGNSALVLTASGPFLIDCGLGPRLLSERLQSVGVRYADLRAVVLTHAHTDHWNKLTLEQLRQWGVPLYIHAGHHPSLCTAPTYEPLARAGLLREYGDTALNPLLPSVAFRAVRVPHDADPTFALRIQSADGWTLGWATDLGVAPPTVIDFLRGVDVLGLEFNHDVGMQRSSARPQFLIDRVLGHHGHLSNEQACAVLQGLLDDARAECLAAVVQLHLSQDCNTPVLAASTGAEAIRRMKSKAKLLTAKPHIPSASIPLPRRQLA